MANDKNSPYVAYGTLAGACLVALVTYFDYSTSRELATDPQARPDSFTGSDGEKLRQECERRIKELSHKTDREFDQLHREIEKLESQILYLYQQHAAGNE